jgi:hypothetical protein
MSAGVIMKLRVVIASVSGRPCAVSASAVRAKLSVAFCTMSGVALPLIEMRAGVVCSSKSVSVTCVCWNASSKNRSIFDWY